MTNTEIKLNAWGINYESQIAVQGEVNSRTLSVTLIDKVGEESYISNAESVDRPVDLTDVTARLYVIKPDGTKTFSDGTVTDATSGKVEFVLPAQAVTIAGNIPCQILLTKSDNSTLKITGLTLEVQPSNLEGAVESSDDFSALVVALNSISYSVTAAAQAVTDSQEAIANANAATTTANASTNAANTAADNANNKANLANIAANTANTSAAAANAAKTNCDTAAAYANDRASAANYATENANGAATSATQAATDAQNATSALTDALANSNEATNSANTAAANANSKASLANTAAGTANTAASNADGKATAANTAATNANNAASAANTAATNANNAADAANLAATNANDKNTAAKLLTARNISLTGKVTGTATPFDGSVDISIPVTAVNATTLNGYGTDNGSYSVLLSGRKASTTIGSKSTAEGSYTIASGYNSHSEGAFTTASGDSSHTEGSYTVANVYESHAQGRYNKSLSGSATSFSTASDAMVIGNGASSSALSNCFRVTFDGKVYGLSAFSSSGADYSEFFEWLDGNPNSEDRVGHFVTLDGEKIRYANDGDYIVGIVSGNPSVIGDHPSESWTERYLRDVYGRLIYEDVVIPEYEEKDSDENVLRTVPEHTETRFKVNPDYDPVKESEYENREKRPEWDTVGMVGKLVCIDDGTCQVNGFCKPSNGIATASGTGYRVIARLDDTHIKVLIKGGLS